MEAPQGNTARPVTTTGAWAAGRLQPPLPPASHHRRPFLSTGANPPTPARFDRGGLVGGPQHVSLLAVEVHAASRPASAAAGARSTRLLLPDPAVDPILCVVLVGTDNGVHPRPGGGTRRGRSC